MTFNLLDIFDLQPIGHIWVLTYWTYLIFNLQGITSSRWHFNPKSSMQHSRHHSFVSEKIRLDILHKLTALADNSHEMSGLIFSEKSATSRIKRDFSE